MTEAGTRGNGARRPDWPRKLLAWYARNRRALPWREDASPYRVWVSEIMLQQTRADTVIPYYQRFLNRFPTVQSLAAADLQDVLRVWEGLGYYSRARNMHRAARIVADTHGGIFPNSHDDLLGLPGIGLYTAAAVASIAFGESVPAIDGNVLRLFARFRGIECDVRSTAVHATIREDLTETMAGCPPGDFNQALMELGALVCTPAQPDCAHCPLADTCVALAANLTGKLPVRRPKARVPHYHIAVGLVWQDGKLLIARRAEDQMLGGLWEFPGGKQENGEELEQTVVREVQEETGLIVRALDPLCTVKHAYSHFRITLTAFHCQVLAGALRISGGRPAQWIAPEELEHVPFPKANRKVLEHLHTWRQRAQRAALIPVCTQDKPPTGTENTENGRRNKSS